MCSVAFSGIINETADQLKYLVFKNQRCVYRDLNSLYSVPYVVISKQGLTTLLTPMHLDGIKSMPTQGMWGLLTGKTITQELRKSGSNN